MLRAPSSPRSRSGTRRPSAATSACRCRPGPMISLTAALDGVCTLWAADGGERQIAVADFVLGPLQNALKPGELLRSITLPAAALKRRTAFRQISLAPFGRSGALVIGTRAADGAFALTVTASTPRPVTLAFAAMPDAAALRTHIERAVTGLVRRHPRPARLAPAHDAALRRRDPPRARGRVVSYPRQRRAILRAAGAGPMPAHLPAPARLVRRQERLRRRRLRRLHGAGSTASRCTVAWCPRSAPRAAR